MCFDRCGVKSQRIAIRFLRSTLSRQLLTSQPLLISQVPVSRLLRKAIIANWQINASSKMIKSYLNERYSMFPIRTVAFLCSFDKLAHLRWPCPKLRRYFFHLFGSTGALLLASILSYFFLENPAGLCASFSSFVNIKVFFLFLSLPTVLTLENVSPQPFKRLSNCHITLRN